MKPSNNLETRILQTLIGEFNQYQENFRLQQGPDAFDKSGLIMAFLTILGLTEILCSFRLVVEGETGKEIPESSRLEFLEKFSANNFAISDAEHLQVLEQRRHSRFTFVENTTGNLPKLLRAKFLESDGLLFYQHMQVQQLEEPFCDDYQSG